MTRIWRAFWWLMVSLAVASLIRLGLPNRKSLADLTFQSLNALVMLGWGLYMLYRRNEPPREYAEPETWRELPWVTSACFFILGVSKAVRQSEPVASQTSLPTAEPGNRDQKVADAP